MSYTRTGASPQHSFDRTIHRAVFASVFAGHGLPKAASLANLAGFNPIEIACIDIGDLLGHFERATRLDPSLPNANRLIGIGCAHFDAGRYEEAVLWKLRVCRANPLQPGSIRHALAIGWQRLRQWTNCVATLPISQSAKSQALFHLHGTFLTGSLRD
jgi:hypothetical protein